MPMVLCIFLLEKREAINNYIMAKCLFLLEVSVKLRGPSLEQFFVSALQLVTSPSSLFRTEVKFITGQSYNTTRVSESSEQENSWVLAAK